MRMSAEDIAEYEFLKRLKRLMPIAMLICGLMGSLITLTWKSKTFIDTLATKQDIKEIIAPITSNVARNTTRIDSMIASKPKGYKKTNFNGIIMLSPVY